MKWILVLALRFVAVMFALMIVAAMLADSTHTTVGNVLMGAFIVGILWTAYDWRREHNAVWERAEMRQSVRLKKMEEKVVSDTVQEWLKGIQTEIGAGEVLAPKSDVDRAWNDACMRAMRIVKHYETGEGLFQ